MARAKAAKDFKVRVNATRTKATKPMSKAHRQKISEAMKARWAARQAPVIQPVGIQEGEELFLTFKDGQATLSKEPVAAATPRTLMYIISEIDLTMARLNELHRELDALIGD